MYPPIKDKITITEFAKSYGNNLKALGYTPDEPGAIQFFCACGLMIQTESGKYGFNSQYRKLAIEDADEPTLNFLGQSAAIGVFSDAKFAQNVPFAVLFSNALTKRTGNNK